MDRTDYECVLRLSGHRIAALARKQLGLVHVSPQIDRDLLLCLQRLEVADLLNHAIGGSSRRIVSVVLTPKAGTSLMQFNDTTIRLKEALGASWWE
ncbi:hypothetical protein VW23_018310 [Devosia insulae DS-56]|uniref:Uncharacterized protein n=1 Tax=Devosia insulae DS-56 TaxID=1116389 RepID=A0A1E5XR05_9HYPH|nr:hypothetical protein [Devosia insulae]OEO31042.1 hypothetical protein VW23_018310 [Devosia insulae DS-56]